jgi:hypothetical protein
VPTQIVGRSKKKNPFFFFLAAARMASLKFFNIQVIFAHTLSGFFLLFEAEEEVLLLSSGSRLGLPEAVRFSSRFPFCKSLILFRVVPPRSST